LAEDTREFQPGWDAAVALAEWSVADFRKRFPEFVKPLVIEPERAVAAAILPASGPAFEDIDRSILGTGRTRPPEFPIEVFDPFWRDWCQLHAKTRSAPVDYVACGLLAAASSLIGNARWARISPEWREPPVLWIALVGGPSSGKSPALDPVLRMVRDIETQAMDEARPAVEQREGEIQQAKAATEAWQAALRQAAKNGDEAPRRPVEAIEPEPLSLPRLVTGDCTVEKLASILRDRQKSPLSMRDELAGWIEGFGRYSGAGGADRSFWLEAFGGRAFRVDRQSRSEPLIIERLAISVLGGIQPDRLPVISSGADDGFAARFLYAWPDPPADFLIGREAVPGDRHRLALKRLADLTLVTGEDGRAAPAYLSLDARALAHLEQFGGEMRRASNDSIGPLAGCLGKAAAYAARLALVLEMLRWSATGGSEPGEISEASMLCGIGLIEAYFVEQARRVFHEASMPPDEQAARLVARWILSEGIVRFNAREARRKIGGIVREARTMAGACAALVDCGVIAPEPGRGDTGGRPRLDFVVNPAIRGATP
jgi:hypothetical protein